MTVIWGLDLHDLQWYKFKSSYMFGNRDYHLRRTKFVVYQLAMILCVVSESIGTAALSKYVEQQDEVESLHSSATVHNDDFVGIASYNIFVGIYVATIFGAAFFFDLFFPARYEPMNIRWAWRLCAVFACLAGLGDAIAFTVIVAKGRARVTADSADQEAIARAVISPPLRYRDNGEALASLVLLWLGWVATVASTCIMFAFYRHVGNYGPMSHGAKWRSNVENGGKPPASDMSSLSTPQTSVPERSTVQRPPPVEYSSFRRGRPRYQS